MAYAHCHNCDWAQDDFWNFGKGSYWWIWAYNPFSLLLHHVIGWRHGYWRPRWIEWDIGYAREMGWSSPRRHSWRMIGPAFMQTLRSLRHQHWWTYASFKKAIDANDGHWPACPKCGEQKLDVD